MGEIVKGKYVYSLGDCACDVCLHYQRKPAACRLAECCCLEEKREALLRFPPDGYEQRKGRAPCRG